MIVFFVGFGVGLVIGAVFGVLFGKRNPAIVADIDAEYREIVDKASAEWQKERDELRQKAQRYMEESRLLKEALEALKGK